MKKLGCFNNKKPFDEIGLYRENSPLVIKTEFFLYCNENQTDAETAEELSYVNIDSIRNSKFNPNLPLKIIVHGYANDIKTPWLDEMRVEFFKVKN